MNAKLVPARGLCLAAGCTRPASHVLVDRYGRRRGVFCSRHGPAALRQLQPEEPAPLPPQNTYWRNSDPIQAQIRIRSCHRNCHKPKRLL
jgi:hypothetical protein